MNPPIGRVDVLGVGISLVSQQSACDEIERWITSRERHYVCVTGVHGVMESQYDPDLARIHNASGLTVPDGMPMVWAAHRIGASHVERTSGPDLMPLLLERGETRGWRSFFYGGKEGVPEELVRRLIVQFPRLEVAGTYSPPFRPLTPTEDDAVVKMINDANPDLLWVGLSTPKQERWMAAHLDVLEVPAMLGVGAAFDIYAGLTRRAPVWMQKRGLEWLFRLVTEPKRLWRRYLTNNPRFVLSIIRRPPRPMVAPPST